jgi:hypothetical protein
MKCSINSMVGFFFLCVVLRFVWTQDFSLVDIIMERWLDNKGSDLINGLTHWWIHNLMTLLGVGGNFRRWVYWEEVVTWVHVLGGYILPWVPLCLDLCFLATMRWTTLSWQALLLPWCFASPQARNNGVMDWNLSNHD